MHAVATTPAEPLIHIALAQLPGPGWMSAAAAFPK